MRVRIRRIREILARVVLAACAALRAAWMPGDDEWRACGVEASPGESMDGRD
jgi:hypothetical protein